MKTAHTPGPWHYKLSGNVVDNRGARVATASEVPGQDEMERLANARLIAAAPELLAALKASLHVLETLAKTHGYDTSIGVVPQARAVVAKAKGGQ